MLGKALSAAALTLLATAPAEAACTQASIAGSWAAILAGARVADGSFFWFECGLAINAAGKTIAGSCTDSDGVASQVTGPVHLSVPANCVFTGALELTNFGATVTINHATLSLDKQTVLGVASNGPQKFTFSMLKVK